MQAKITYFTSVSYKGTNICEIKICIKKSTKTCKNTKIN